MKLLAPSSPQRRLALSCASLALSIAAAAPAFATEGGLGRSLTGLQVTPYVGVVPPEPGFQWSLGYAYYDGKIGGSRQVPIAGQVSLGLQAEMNLYTATGVYVWPTGQGRWNFASMVTAPWIDVDLQANLSAGSAQRRVNQSASDWFDLYFAPVIASYHVSEVEHVSLGLYVYAPTGKYDASRLANPGMNVWTISPAVGYTHLFQQGTLETSLLAGIDFSTRNNDTDYKNGAIWRLDALLVKRTASGWGFGAAAGWIQQIQDDDGALADRLDGFKGHSWGLGPVITYGKKWSGGEHLDLTLRYIDEFSVKNRFEGEPLMLSASFGF